MKLFSCEAKLLCTMADDTDEDEMVKVFSREHAKLGDGILQLYADAQTIMVKHVREHSNECVNLETLRTIIPAEHVPQTRGFLKEKWLLLERVPPVFASMHSFKDLLMHSRTVPADVMQTCLAQIVALLCTAQERDPLFAHNDLKADNILLRPETREGPVSIGRFSVKHVGVRVVLIDMETVTGNRFPSVHLPQLPRDKLEVFGLDPSMPWCCWTDFHLVCMEMWKSIRLQRPKWSSACIDFFAAATPTTRVFSTFDEGNVLVTCMNRLSTKGRSTVNALIDTGSMKRLQDLSMLPFLSSWMSAEEDQPPLMHISETPDTTATQQMPTHTPMENDIT